MRRPFTALPFDNASAFLFEDCMEKEQRIPELYRLSDEQIKKSLEQGRALYRSGNQQPRSTPPSGDSKAA